MSLHTNTQVLEDDDSKLARRSIPEPLVPASARSRRVYDSVADLIADPDNPTPMIRLSDRFKPAPDFNIYVKLERNNPFGSIKDRTALYLLNGTPLKKDQVLAEPTAGNTGIALAALANARGTPIELAVPEGTPEEKKALLRFLGAELLEVEDELCPLFPTEGARGVVKSLVESDAFNGRYVSPNQYENELNVEAHYRTTGPEIWNQTEGNIDFFFWPLAPAALLPALPNTLKNVSPVSKLSVSSLPQEDTISRVSRKSRTCPKSTSQKSWTIH